MLNTGLLFAGKGKESEKTGSCQESNPGSLAWASLVPRLSPQKQGENLGRRLGLSCQCSEPLSYDRWTSTSPHYLPQNNKPVFIFQQIRDVSKQLCYFILTLTLRPFAFKPFCQFAFKFAFKPCLSTNLPQFTAKFYKGCMQWPQCGFISTCILQQKAVRLLR